MTTFLKTLLADDGGQDLIEFALLAGLISLVAVATILNVGNGVNGVWEGVDATMTAISVP